MIRTAISPRLAIRTFRIRSPHRARRFLFYAERSGSVPPAIVKVLTITKFSDGKQGGFAQRGVGEFGHPLGEPGLRAETEVARGTGGGGHDVPDVAEAELAGHHGVYVAERGGQRAGHLADRVRLAARDVVAAQRPVASIVA